MTTKNHKNHLLTDINTVSVALTSDPALNQTHLGILYDDGDNNISLLHFENYKKLSKDPPSNNYIWVDVAFTKTQKEFVALLCDEIFNNNQSTIPYDIDMEGTYFDENYNFIIRATCKFNITKHLIFNSL